MEKQIGKIWLRWLCAGLLCLSALGNGCLRAEGVPPVIKYQAVLRDLEGEPMAERAGLAVRITLRQGSTDGTILYQETHTDLTTDAFGLLLLEIGRGDVSNAGYGSLSDVPWENSPIYTQVEIQADENGYTMMGASELLSVPYALYAGNASVGYGLTDGFLPKYDAGYLNLVDSKVSETYDGQLQFYTGDDAYKFPTARGNRNQTLTLIDDEGTLGWRAGGGGGGAGCEDCRDGFLTYWDDVAGQLRSTNMRYDEAEEAVYAGSQFISPELMIVENELEINATVSGSHNLQYSDLPRNNVWVGNGQDKSEPYRLGGGGVTIDSLNKVLRFDGGGGASVWGFQPEGTIDYVYTRMNDGQYVRVGIGLERPKTRLHVQDGALLLSGTPGDDQDAPGDWEQGNHLYWHAGKGALRMGKLETGTLSLWNTANIGENSIALGTEAKAGMADNVAIGKKTDAQGVNAMVFGQNSVASDEMGLALGHNLVVSGLRAVGIGHGSANNIANPSFVASGQHCVAMGYDVKNAGNDALTIGKEITLSSSAANSVVLGIGHEVEGENDVAIGDGISDKKTSGATAARNFQIGQDLTVEKVSDAINIGAYNDIKDCEAGFINIGQFLKTKKLGFGINIGVDNEIGLLSGSSKNNYGPIVIGQNLRYEDDTEGTVILGVYNDETLAFWDVPALVVGAGTDRKRKNVLELSDEGELHILGNQSSIRVKTVDEWSDIRLKTDILPLEADYSVLQALQPVRYRFKDDEKQTLQFGFIAQDVERYFPHLVKTNRQGIKSLNYTGLLPVLWQYTQRLEQTVETQAAEIDRLKTELETLKGDIQAIKAAMGLGE